MKSLSCLASVACVLVALTAAPNMVQAATIIADSFSRADDTALGSTETGGRAWSERTCDSGSQFQSDVASISGGELLFGTVSTQLAMIDAGYTDLTASVRARFVGDTSGTATTKALGLVLRGSNMDAAWHTPPANQGTVSVQLSSSGGLLVGEVKTGALEWLYIANPWNGAVDYGTYGVAGSLPTAINGAAFDANGDGHLGSDEPFQLGAAISGNSLNVLVNGTTIQTLSLANASGTTGSLFGLIRNNLGGAGDAPTGAFDNLTIDAVPEPSSLVMVLGTMIGLVAYAWRKRR